MDEELPTKQIAVIKPSQLIVITPTPEIITIQPREAQAVTIKQRPTAVIKPSESVTVKPPERGAWDERGWTRQTESGRETYEGFYQVVYKRLSETRQFRGRVQVIVSGWGKGISLYIYNPPPEVKGHKHGPCFQLVKDGWFHLHWSRPARNVDDAILYMERVLDESLNRRGW